MRRNAAMGRGDRQYDDQIGRTLVEKVFRDDEDGPLPRLNGLFSTWRVRSILPVVSSVGFILPKVAS